MSRLAALAVAALGLGPALVARAEPLCVVFADGATGAILRQRGDCTTRHTPASSFKLALSLMGFDAGYLIDEHHPALPYQEAYAARDPAWRTTIDPSSWISASVVWYSQQLTRALGPERLQRYVTRFGYGNQDLSGNPGMNDGLTQAWLDSSLRISPLEQVAFLHRLVTRQLGVAARAYEMTARLTAAGTVAGWEVHGKTGTGYQMQPGERPDLRREIGWYVGWATHGTRTVVFACLIGDTQPESTHAGPRAKAQLLSELPQVLAAPRP